MPLAYVVRRNAIEFGDLIEKNLIVAIIAYTT